MRNFLCDLEQATNLSYDLLLCSRELEPVSSLCKLNDVYTHTHTPLVQCLAPRTVLSKCYFLFLDSD